MTGVVCFFLGVLVTMCVYCWAVYDHKWWKVHDYDDTENGVDDK